MLGHGVCGGLMQQDDLERGPKIQVRNLTKIFGPDSGAVLESLDDERSKADLLAETGHVIGVRNASFDVRPGEIFVIMGLSGCGKSTLVRMMNRLVEPTSGEVLIDGADVTRMPRRDLIEFRRREIAMVFQSFALMPHMTALENAAFGLDVAGVPEPERSEKATQALATVGLSEFADRHPADLSGGMQQRVGLARALSLDPTIMLMDEAFSALDPLIRTGMQDELLTIQRERKMTVVFVSHDLNEALRIGDRLAIMSNGEVEQIGTPKELVLNPATDHVRAFFHDADVRRVITAADLADAPPATLMGDGTAGLEQAREVMGANGAGLVYVADAGGVFRGVASRESVEAALEVGSGQVRAALLPDIVTLSPEQSFVEVADIVAEKPWPVPVVDEAGCLLGVVTPSAMLTASLRER
jgi:glycine betaine/proline transport system ATP-binding protein